MTAGSHKILANDSVDVENGGQYPHRDQQDR
jgi:hypothetical protein